MCDFTARKDIKQPDKEREQRWFICINGLFTHPRSVSVIARENPYKVSRDSVSSGKVERADRNFMSIWFDRLSVRVRKGSEVSASKPLDVVSFPSVRDSSRSEDSVEMRPKSSSSK